MASSTVNEINANAGGVGTSYNLTLTAARDDRLRIHASPTRTATLTNVSGGTLRCATVANDGTFGTFADVAAGASQTVVAADGARDFLLQGAPTASVRVVIS